MMTPHLAAFAAVAALALGGPAATDATEPAPTAAAAVANCKRTYTATENVKIHVTDHGGPPGSASSPAPPKNDADREHDTVVGLLLKGRQACNVGPADPVEGGTYEISRGSTCAPGRNNVWSKIRTGGVTGWVPRGCGFHT